MIKWLFLAGVVGCLANASNLSKKVNADDLDEDLDDDLDNVALNNISQEKVDIPWSPKEQLYWGIGALISFIMFLIL
ncbi:hypothetical protein [Streptococcus pasteurianus]|jgi:hypothetical protein|nr:phage protein [Streptococcus pasteurianus]